MKRRACRAAACVFCLAALLTGCAGRGGGTSEAGSAVSAQPETDTDGSVPEKTVYNLIDYGADPTGIQDSYPAFEKMFEAIGSKNNIEVKIPAGTFRLSQRYEIVAEVSGYYGLTFSGAGEETTQILCDNDTGGFLFRGVTTNVNLHFRDMTFVAPDDGCGTALEFNIPAHGVVNEREVNATNLLIRGLDYQTGYFNKGIVVSNAWWPTLTNVKVTDKYAIAPGVYQNMTHAIELNNCYSPTIKNCYVWGGQNGITVNAAGGTPEDGIITDTYCVANIIGINLNISDEQCEPNFKINNCHVDYRDTGILVKGVRQINIRSNVFYCADRDGSKWLNSTEPARDFRSKDIDLQFAQDVIISDNQFVEPSNDKRIGVYISPKSSHVWLSNNIFGMEGTCIVNESNGPCGTLSNNIFQDAWGFGRSANRLDDKTGTFVQ